MRVLVYSEIGNSLIMIVMYTEDLVQRRFPMQSLANNNRQCDLYSSYSCSTTIVTALLPHLDTLDLHLSFFLPRWVPLVLRTPEVLLRGGATIQPRFAGGAVLEPTILAANSHIDHKVEILVEGRCVAVGVRPWIEQACAIGVSQRKPAVRPERLVEVRVHDLREARVDIGENILLTPL